MDDDLATALNRNDRRRLDSAGDPSDVAAAAGERKRRRSLKRTRSLSHSQSFRFGYIFLESIIRWFQLQ